ncbi:MAG: hypothetical protein H6745_13805 [Deltaproteobacteria bacterium]|nr:hypothetical protein [Deltaproteobacteria bacterium]
MRGAHDGELLRDDGEVHAEAAELRAELEAELPPEGDVALGDEIGRQDPGPRARAEAEAQVEGEDVVADEPGAPAR